MVRTGLHPVARDQETQKLRHAFVLVTAMFALSLVAEPAMAQLQTAGLLDRVQTSYQDASQTWLAPIVAAASRLFWILATISLVWMGGQLIMRKADIGEFFGELVRYMLFIGFFWWLIQNAATFGPSIVNGLNQLGAEAGNTAAVTPSAIMDVGFSLFIRALNAKAGYIDQLGVTIAGVVVMILFALIAVNMLIIVITSWIVMYAGVFFLGFGGSRWTSDIAVGYFRAALAMGIHLLTLNLIAGIGMKFIDDQIGAMEKGAITWQSLGVMMVSAVVLLMIVTKVPPALAGIATGNMVGLNGIGNYGVGSAVAAAAGTVAMVTVATHAVTGGAAAASGAADLAGSLMRAGQAGGAASVRGTGAGAGADARNESTGAHPGQTASSAGALGSAMGSDVQGGVTGAGNTSASIGRGTPGTGGPGTHDAVGGAGAPAHNGPGSPGTVSSRAPVAGSTGPSGSTAGDAQGGVGQSPAGAASQSAGSSSAPIGATTGSGSAPDAGAESMIPGFETDNQRGLVSTSVSLPVSPPTSSEPAAPGGSAAGPGGAGTLQAGRSVARPVAYAGGFAKGVGAALMDADRAVANALRERGAKTSMGKLAQAINEGTRRRYVIEPQGPAGSIERSEPLASESPDRIAEVTQFMNKGQ